jgi:hypothetical protein
LKENNDHDRNTTADDNNRKAKMTRRGVREHETKIPKFQVDDLVLLKNQNPSKTQPLYDPNPFRIVKINRTQVKFRRNATEYRRNTKHHSIRFNKI